MVLGLSRWWISDVTSLGSLLVVDAALSILYLLAIIQEVSYFIILNINIIRYL